MRSQPSLGSRQSCQAVYRQALLLNAARHPNKPTASPVKARNAVVAPARSGAASLTDAEQKRQRVALEDIADGFEVDSLVTVSFADDLRGLAAAEPVRSAALLTVPLRSTLGVQVEEDGTLTILSPLELPPNVKKAFEAVASLIRHTPGHQHVILAALLLWARKYGNDTWQRYCSELLPPEQELSCLLCYTPAELPLLQLPHLVDEASRQHDWARWAHSQWLSSSSGALRRLGLADSLADSTWALANVRSRAVEFPLGLGAAARTADGARDGAASAGGAAAPPPGPVAVILAPVVDLINHSHDPNCVVQLTTDRSRVVLLPRRPVAAGEPLTLDYGANRSSLEFMADYGFVLTANRRDGDVPLPDAEKLPPLEVPRVEAAGRALMRAAAAAAEDAKWEREASGGMEVADADEVVQVDGQVVQVDEEGSGRGAGGADEGGAYGRVNGVEVHPERVRAAVSLLRPQSSLAPGAAASGFSSLGTQRVVAGLWHKLVTHTLDSLPTTREQDARAVTDIEEGRAPGTSGAPGSGVSTWVNLDPRPIPGAGDDQAPPRPTRGSSNTAAAAAAAEAAAAAAAAAAAVTAEGDGRTGDGIGSSLEDSGQGSEVGRSTSGAAASPAESLPGAGRADSSRDSSMGGSGGSSGGGGRASCRSGVRSGRVYAALRARVEHKELLAVAAELLLHYAR